MVSRRMGLGHDDGDGVDGVHHGALNTVEPGLRPSAAGLEHDLDWAVIVQPGQERDRWSHDAGAASTPVATIVSDCAREAIWCTLVLRRPRELTLARLG
jgi:hypothetical protein